MFKNFKKGGHRKPSKSSDSSADASSKGIGAPGPGPTSKSGVGAPAQNTVEPVVPPPMTHVEPLPLLGKSPAAERQNLFMRKLQVCCFQFDFTDTLKSAREKEIKRQTLLELVDFIQSGTGKVAEACLGEMIKMVGVNIFRCLPPASHESSGTEVVDPDEEENYSEPSWQHLQIVYELLLREREYLKMVLHRIYGKFMVHRPLIRKSISNIFYRFIYETERHSGVGELLEILGSIINGFSMPMREEHKLFLMRALIPLHKTKQVGNYHQQLSYCIVQFVDKDYKLADMVIRGLLKYWPLVNCQKEVLFLGELEEVLEETQSAEFQRCMVPLFRKIARCLNSPHFQVAERALFFWNSEHIVSLIAENRQVILPIIFEALEKNIQSHWNTEVHGLTVNVRKMFLEMDAELVDECQKQLAEKQAKAREVAEQREMTWKKLEDAARK
ncbi:hypothetical protein E1A91_D11G391800v1 [Gossypium mustelinum]|uniref:Serine/threonine protein phosphatase 2A regulatory subunit n=2 Tax=Gossypium TaxID=3633 RepID=A0A0D2PKG0_GOSRA|nr:hypothetical protein B456_007G372900 [Gossypium raimondii]TYI58862.1 hypothetical protein E1A91_D11G391800v1 [Gossypium mustelinum]